MTIGIIMIAIIIRTILLVMKIRIARITTMRLNLLVIIIGITIAIIIGIYLMALPIGIILKIGIILL